MPGDVRPPGFVLDHDEQAEEDGVEVGEVDGEDGLGLRGEELVPGPDRSGAGSIPAAFKIFLSPRGDQLAVITSLVSAGA
jgi:hypothetical protein